MLLYLKGFNKELSVIDHNKTTTLIHPLALIRIYPKYPTQKRFTLQSKLNRYA